ncbi:nuclear transport factor 2 family protein [Microbacterium rhizomatis]|uniref:nuclear transport factor 2 family protein n=1 Tax=Microbacterium rhizomatis TaxID=1631477 RepID=UPI0014791D6D|nr:nuclear transport factor 2 family protein [Microbacterium rhizomatis]
MALISSVERLLAEDAVRRALLAYCRGVDRGDAALAVSAYHPDGVDHHGTWDGRVDGHFADALARLVDRTRSTVHVLGPSAFDWIDTRTVRVESNVMALHEVEVDGRRTIEHLHGRYLDLFTCTDGDWAISERMFVHDLDFLDDRAAAAYPPHVFANGARGADDPAHGAGRAG